MHNGHKWIATIACLITLPLVFAVPNRQTASALYDISCQNLPLEGSGIAGVLAATFSPDSKTLLVEASNAVGVLWDINSGTILHCLQGQSGVSDGATVAFSPDGKSALTAMISDNTVRLWDVHTGALQHKLRSSINIRGLSGAVYSPDGKTVLMGSSDGLIILWDAQTGNALLTMKNDGYGISSLAYAPDGKMILIGLDNNDAQLWDAQTGKLLHELQGHSQPITAVAY